MKIARRLGWIVLGTAGLPGLAVGVVTGFAFGAVPLTFLFGLAVGRSTFGTGVAIGLYSALVVAFTFTLGDGFGEEYWLFYAGYGVSALFAIPAIFKIASIAGSRAFGSSP